MAKTGDIYSVRIFYEDNTQEYKNRPVLIINVEEDLVNFYTVAEITKSAPSNPPRYYDRFKEPILHWRKSGLKSPSYVKTHKIHKIPEDKLLKFCGELEENELIRILYRIVEVNT